MKLMTLREIKKTVHSRDRTKLGGSSHSWLETVTGLPKYGCRGLGDDQKQWRAEDADVKLARKC